MIRRFIYASSWQSRVEIIRRLIHAKAWRRRKIFICYRRSDTEWYADDIHAKLKAAFGDTHVFLDVGEIQPGDLFGTVIQERIAQCDVFLALIGPKWITDNEGRKRIHDENDYVRHEITTALRMGKRVIPVLLEGARMPVASELPSDIEGLADRDALELTKLEIREGADRLIKACLGYDPFAVFTDLMKRRWANALAIASALVLLSAAWVRLFDVFALDTKTASFTVWLADIVVPEPPSALVHTIVITAGTERALGKVFRRNPAARRDHAALITLLAQAGVRSIAFDILIARASADDDAVLAQAIRSARAVGTEVVFGTNEVGKPPTVEEALSTAVTTWPMLCIGERLGYASTVPLASQAESKASGVGAGEPLQARTVGLALAAAKPGRARIDPELSRLVVWGGRNDDLSTIRYSALQRINSAQPCPVGQPGDQLAVAIHRRSSLAALHQESLRIAYEQVLAMDPAALRRRFEGKTVLVGMEFEDEDVFPTFQGLGREVRYGLDLHADATDALLKDRIIQPLSVWVDFAVLLALALAGTRLRLWSPAGLRWPRRSLLLLVLLACMAFAVWLCLAHDLLFNVTYAATALAVGYWATGRIARGRRAAPAAQAA